MELISNTGTELIGKLRERYGVSKTVVYNRLKFLSIEVTKQDGNFFLRAKELELLDELHNWIESGNSTNSFPRPGVLVHSETGGIEAGSIPVGTGETEIPTAEEGNQIRALVRSAQEKAAGLIMAQNILTAQFKDNPDMMDDDLRQQVRATEEAIAPKSLDPKQYALGLVARYRSLSPA
ncbi:MAG: hypothetical protein N5P05_004194 (plasmid) [Chroococcopsis gigantea SAG 12.99]|jgi:hypothetical protein|nr:hypothetical protein [Chroococcopsis gigantea SAG 12.99]